MDLLWGAVAALISEFRHRADLYLRQRPTSLRGWSATRTIQYELSRGPMPVLYETGTVSMAVEREQIPGSALRTFHTVAKAQAHPCSPANQSRSQHSCVLLPFYRPHLASSSGIARKAQPAFDVQVVEFRSTNTPVISPRSLISPAICSVKLDPGGRMLFRSMSGPPSQRK